MFLQTETTLEFDGQSFDTEVKKDSIKPPISEKGANDESKTPVTHNKEVDCESFNTRKVKTTTATKGLMNGDVTSLSHDILI